MTQVAVMSPGGDPVIHEDVAALLTDALRRASQAGSLHPALGELACAAERLAAERAGRCRGTATSGYVVLDTVTVAALIIWLRTESTGQALTQARIVWGPSKARGGTRTRMGLAVMDERPHWSAHLSDAEFIATWLAFRRLVAAWCDPADAVRLLDGE